MWTLPPARNGIPASDDLLKYRAGAADSAASQRLVDGVVVRDATIGGVSCLVCEPPEWRRTIVHLHGGGFRLGHPRGWTGFASRLGMAAGARVIVPDYRLAPEHPFPCALHDVAAVYDALSRERSGALLIGGDSAGGGLALSLAVAARGHAPAAAGVILISPWLDLTITAETYESCAGSDRMFPRELATNAANQYLQGQAADDPLASPLFADLAGLPPVLLFAGGAEVLLGDGIALARRLALAGVTVESHFVAGMQHVWPTLSPDLPESRAALDAMVRFTKSFG